MKKSVKSLELRKLIVKLCNKDKLSIRNISKTVRKAKSVIHSILRKLEETGSCKAKKLPGRPRKTTAREDMNWRWIIKGSICDKNLDMKVSRQTIFRRLNEIKLNSRVASTNFYTSKKNKMSLLKFATEHVIWTEERWDCVQFNDELKFNLFGRPKERYSLQCTKNSVKFVGGSVMVFGMISAAGTGPNVRLHGKINATVYKELWKKHVVLNL